MGKGKTAKLRVGKIAKSPLKKIGVSKRSFFSHPGSKNSAIVSHGREIRIGVLPSI